MLLLSARLAGVAPFFEELSLPFAGERGEARMMTVLHGGAGVGKTAVIGAIAATRPGHAVALSPGAVGEGAPSAACEWALGMDDPERPHPLAVASPSAGPAGDEGELFRRREQAHFDRVAREGGFAFLSLSSTRWFSRQPLSLNAPARTVARYDVRSPAGLDDAQRSDLGRETKQALAYAAISAALSRGPARGTVDHELLGAAMQAAVSRLVGLTGFSYEGVCPATFEPLFTAPDGGPVSFDALPTQSRHLVAFAALPVRMLWGAYPGRDPRTAEGVVTIDDADLHQHGEAQQRLPAALRAALPRVQWILTTSSPALASAAESGEVLALRRSSDARRVELYAGAEARVH